MKLRTILASFAAIALLTSCEDLFEEGDMQPDGSNPSLTINTPSNNQTITSSQGLLLDLTAVDKDMVKELEVVLKSQTGEQRSLISFSKSPQLKVVEFDTLVSVQGIQPGTYNLIISATDFRTNLTVEEVLVTIK